MAFSKKTWKDRVSQYINRRLLTDSDGNTQQVTVTRDEGSVTEAGDAFSASNMNDLEDRIEDAFDGLTAADIPYSAGVSVADMLDSNTTDGNYLVPVYNNEKILKITETSTAYYISGYVRVNGNVAANTKLYTFAKNIVKSEFFLGFIGTSGCRIQIVHTDKSLKTLDAIADKQYLNFSAYAIKL